MGKKIEYPYLPEGVEITYVQPDHRYMRHLREYAFKYAIEKVMPNASLVDLDGEIVAIAANGSDYHNTHACKRVELNVPTGQGYELCEGCHPKNHSESRCARHLSEKGIDVSDGMLYLWGHWWCCEPCWKNMMSVGIRHVVLLEGSEVLFNKSAVGNIVGKQFAGG